MKVNWKSVLKNVLTLGVSFLLDRYISKKVPPAVVGMLGDVLEGNTDKVPKELHEAIDHAISKKVQAHVEAGLAKAVAESHGRK